jgi:hypothetical protein
MGYKTTDSGDRITAGPERVLGQAKFLRTDDGSAAMNVNGLALGAPTVVWNGTGAGDSGGDWTHEAQGTESAAAMHSGTNGMDSGVRSAGQDTRFDSGTNQDIAGLYDTLEFWMMPKAYPVGSDFRVRWKTSGGSNPGNTLSIENYVTNMDLDVWQKVSIPTADFALGNDVAQLEFEYGAQGGQHFYLDDIELINAAAGGPFTFQVAAPDATAQFHVSMLVLVLSGAASGWNSTSFANIASGLTNGLLLRQRKVSTSEVAWSINCHDNVDLFGRFHPQDDITFNDGTLLVGFMIKPGKSSIVVTDDDVLEVLVRDDLSTLVSARGFVHYGKEVIG